MTLAVWQQWVGHAVTATDIKALTPDDVAPLYLRNYWNADQCEALPSGLDLCVFDSAVNNGDGRAAIILQNLIGAKPDGAIGSATRAAVLAYVAKVGLAQTIDNYLNARLAFYKTLSGYPEVGHGWTNRVALIRTAEHALC